jgi:hypothetical protein
MTSTCRELGFRLGPALLAPPLPRAGGRLCLIAAVLQEVFGMPGDPDVGQERPQIHVSRGQSDQQLTDIRERLDPVSLGAGKDAHQDRRGLPASSTPETPRAPSW